MGLGFNYLFKIFPDYWGINTTIVFYAAIISYLFHLFADMLTIQGVPLFFPYKRFFGLPPNPLKGLRIVTGKWFENLVIFPAVTIYLIFFVLIHLDDIKKLLFK